MGFVKNLEDAIEKAGDPNTTPEEVAKSPMMLLGTFLMVVTGVGLLIHWVGRSLSGMSSSTERRAKSNGNHFSGSSNILYRQLCMVLVYILT